MRNNENHTIWWTFFFLSKMDSFLNAWHKTFDIQYIYNCNKKKGAKYRGGYVYNTYITVIRKKGPNTNYERKISSGTVFIFLRSLQWAEFWVKLPRVELSLELNYHVLNSALRHFALKERQKKMFEGMTRLWVRKKNSYPWKRFKSTILNRKLFWLWYFY